MNLNKHLDFFDPTTVNKPIHIIGCGAIGSRITELLVRLGCTNIHLWDFDVVNPHNITNQLFRAVDIGKDKTEALEEMMKDINPTVELVVHGAYELQNINGYVFLCVDNIDLRREICTKHKSNRNIKAIFDARMRLTDAQSYGADWNNPDSVNALINTMQFTSDEAKEATPVSACGTTLSVAPTVMTVCSITVTNFMNFIKENKIQSIILLDTFNYNLNAF